MTSEADDKNDGERIAKRLARAGLCSRRDAERWIAEGRVTLNGRTLDTAAVVVRPGDVITVNGEPLPDAEPPRLWRYHKPSGLVTTARDEKGRDTVFDKLPEGMPRVISVGRLDLTTEGLLLLTNDGEMARFLELPSTGWTRRYRVRVHGVVDERRLAALAGGITIEGVRYGAIEAALDKVQGSNAWLTVGIKEGKNREIRKVMETLGLAVNRLIRLSYGPFQLGKLPEGEVEEVPRRVLLDQLGEFFGEEELARLKAAEKAARRSDRGTKPEPGPAERPRISKPKTPRVRSRDDGERGGERARPARGDERARPARGDERARPARGDERARPARGGDSARPTGGGGKRTLIRGEGGEMVEAPKKRPTLSLRGAAAMAKSGAARRDPASKLDGAKPGGAKSFRERPAGGKPGGARSEGGRPSGGKPEGRPAGGKPGGARPEGGRPAGGRPEGRPAGGKPGGAKPEGGRPSSGKPGGGRPGGGRPGGGKPSGGKPGGDKRGGGADRRR